MAAKKTTKRAEADMKLLDMEIEEMEAEVVDEDADTSVVEAGDEAVDYEYEEPKDLSVYVHTFKVPYKFANKTYTTMTFDFSRLKGKDMTNIEREMMDSKDVMIMPEVSIAFLGRLAARAAHVGYDVIENMPIADFSKVKGAAQAFLTSMGF